MSAMSIAIKSVLGATSTIAILGLLSPLSAIAQTLTPVELELSLLVDVSPSIDSNEFNLQKQGYVNAFNDPNLFNNYISQNNLGKIAVNLIYWSGSSLQEQAVGWTLIDSVAASQNFANAINNASRPYNNGTATGSAINFAVPGFSSNNFDGTRKIIDISSDGEQNEGADTATARNNALGAAGINAINALVIGPDTSVFNFYKNNAIGGSNFPNSPAFLVQADTFQQFETTFTNKLRAEVSGGVGVSVPEPAANLGLLALGAIGVASLWQRFLKANSL